MQCLQNVFILSGITERSTYFSLTPVLGIRLFFFALCCYGLFMIVRHYKKLSWKIHYFPLLLFVFWILLSIRLFYEGYTHTGYIVSQNYYDLVRPFLIILYVWLPIFICLRGIPSVVSSRNITIGILAFMVLHCIVACIMYFEPIITGLTLRSEEIHEMTVYKRFGRIGEIALIASIMSCLGLWAVLEKKIPQVFFWSIYTLGIILEHFSSMRTFFVAFIVALCFILIFSTHPKNRKFFLFLIILILTNIGVIRVIGYASKDLTPIGRMFETKEEIVTMTSIISDSVSLIKSDKNLPSNKDNTSAESDIKKFPNFDSIESFKSSTAILSDPLQVEKSKTIQQKEFTWDNICNQFNALVKKAGTHRVNTWMTALKRVTEHPITGTGSAIFLKFNSRPVKFMPHNNIVDAFLMTGVVGGSLFLIILFVSWRNAVIIFRNYPEHAWLAVIFVFSATHLFFGSWLPTHTTLWLSMTTMWALVSEKNEADY
jgi:hypothetical protein